MGWKRDQILKDKLIAEEKARQEEQKRLELEAIRMSIRKKISTQASSENENAIIDMKCDAKMDVENTTEEEQETFPECSNESEASLTPMETEEEIRIGKDCDIEKNDDEMLQESERERLALEEEQRLREEEKRRMEEQEL